MDNMDSLPESEKYIICDICGRMVEISVIVVDDDSEQKVCDLCRAEKESCGCSD